MTQAEEILKAEVNPVCIGTALLVYGTRPEAIKMAPLVGALSAVGVTVKIAVTGQHREMLDQVHGLFGIQPDYDFDLGMLRLTPSDFLAASIGPVSEAITASGADIVVVQGDTTSTLAGATAGFYAQKPVVHVEAGLRTWKRYSPFPEEIHRRVVTQFASMHLAPTDSNRANLIREGVPPEDILVTGNTVIDALLAVSREQVPFTDPRLEDVSNDQLVLVTTHRRESWGPQMTSAMSGVRRLADSHPDTSFVVPVHKNPTVSKVVRQALHGLPNVLLTEPLPYGEFARLLSLSHLILTDSGGVQEEAPGLGVPVLVLREDTERPEAVAAGTVRLIGTDEEQVFHHGHALLTDPAEYSRMSNAVNPFGDGRAGERSAGAVRSILMGTSMPIPFEST